MTSPPVPRSSQDPANEDRLLLGGGEKEAEIDWDFIKNVKAKIATALVEYNNDF